MTKYGKRNRNQDVPHLGVEPAVEPMPAELCPPGEDHNEQDFVWLSEDHRVMTRRRWWRGRMIEFALVQQLLVDCKWVTVLRADTCHEEVHLHVFNARGEEVRREHICGISDSRSIEEGYDRCNERIFDRLDANVRQWADV